MRFRRLLACLLLSAVAGIAAAQSSHNQSASATPGSPRADVADPFRFIDPNADILDVLYKSMQHYNASLDGVAYSLSDDATVEGSWLVQTPNVWGKAPADVPIGAGKFVANDVQSLIAGAQEWVDIMSLMPYPTGLFETAVKNGLSDLARSGRPVTVRILVGWPTFLSGDNQSTYLKRLILRLKNISGSQLTIYVGAQRNSAASWNHAKMVAVDGQRVLVGGENQWDDDYLRVAPVHDLNLLLRGSFVFGMHTFADYVWATVCGYETAAWKTVYWKAGMNDIAKGCKGNNTLKIKRGPQAMRVLGAGRLADLTPKGNPSDQAMAVALASSRSELRIAQQDLGMWPRMFWAPATDAIARAIVAKQHVYIVLSNDGAKAGPNAAKYTTGVSVATTANKIRESVMAQPNSPRGKELTDLLCSHLHLTTLRFGPPPDHWPNKFAFAQHAKFFLVDDRVLYVGSENLYPSDLLEYGVFIADPTVLSAVRTQYWDKLWEYSKRAAISGPEAAKCHFR